MLTLSLDGGDLLLGVLDLVCLVFLVFQANLFAVSQKLT